MSEAISQLNSIKANLERLLRNYTALKNENSILKNQIDAQRKAMADKNLKISEIEQQLSLLKTAQSISKQISGVEVSQAGENHTIGNQAAKQKINELIKEVDKCIALLSS
ncbi:MAG: hypothetical protein ACKVPJ_12190 [Chitinophagales bacterium]